jgi:tetratricopeptide (TPR) repeat protein
MQSWEHLIIQNPGALLDSLNQLDKFSLEGENEAYYYLLRSMAKERAAMGFRMNEIEDIGKSLTWYQSHKKDRRNHCRALLYNGILISMGGSKDSIAYDYLLKADSVYQAFNLEDPYILSKCYEYKSKILRAQKAFPLAEVYLDKAIKAASELNDSVGIVRLKTKLLRLYLLMGNIPKAFQSMSSIQLTQNASPAMEYELCNAMYIFYVSMRESEMATTYLKRMLDLAKKYNLKDVDYNSLNYRLAIYYDNKGIRDSAEKYFLETLKQTNDTVANISYTYPARYAMFLQKYGDSQAACNYYKEAYENLLRYSTTRTREKLLEIDNKNEVAKLSAQLDKAEKHQLYLILVVVVLFFILTYNILKNNHLRRSNVSFAGIEEKEWLLSEISKANASSMPDLIEEVFNEAERSRRYNQTISDNLHKFVKRTKDEMKDQYLQIVNSNRFISAYPYTRYLSSTCSPIDILMLVLVKSGLTNKDISIILSIPYSSVRARKSKIKDVILESSDIPEEEKKIILF